MGQLFKTKGAVSGPKMTDEEIYRAVTTYSKGAAPKQTKSKGLLSAAMREVFSDTPRTVKTSAPAAAQRKQKIAIAYSKARAAGARIPKK
jgi:hypothetical protein